MITKQQRKALLFIEAELERTGGVAPSVREIADHFHHRSTTMARRLLIGLEESGFIRRLPAKTRAIEGREARRPVCDVSARRSEKGLKRIRNDGRVARI
jgi:SOS-response transcriptional repressor LexA